MTGSRLDIIWDISGNIADFSHKHMDTLQSSVGNFMSSIPTTLRNRLLQKVVEVVQPVNAHKVWVMDNALDQTIRFVIYQNPFSFRFAYLKEFGNVLHHELPIKLQLLPQWFEFCKSYELDTKDTYKVLLTETSFKVAIDERSYEYESNGSARFLEVRLSGKDGTLFKQHYPLGIDVTRFGNIVFTERKDVDEENSPLRLYEILPYLLYFATEEKTNVIPYEKDSTELTLLEDDTFEIFTIDWNDPIAAP